MKTLTYKDQEVPAYEHDLEAIREYHDKLRADNKQFMEALQAIADYKRPDGTSYKHVISSLQYIARKAIDETES